MNLEATAALLVAGGLSIDLARLRRKEVIAPTDLGSLVGQVSDGGSRLSGTS